MRRRRLPLWPQSLAGRMIALLLFALIAAQALSLAIFLDERRHAVRAADRAQVLSRVASMVRLLADTPKDLSGRIAGAASGPRLRFWLSEKSAVPRDDPETRRGPLHGRLAALLSGSEVQAVLLRVRDDDSWLLRQWEAAVGGKLGEDGEGWRSLHDGGERAGDWGDDDDEDGGTLPEGRERHPVSLIFAVLLPDGRWLNGETLLPLGPLAWAWATPLSLSGLALAIGAIVVLSVRRITRPMRALATAADQFGRGQRVAPLDERGPEDLRHTIRAFNQMLSRLERFVSGRTRMLAAVSHDLRTPITSLRLRAEFVEDPQTREKILETLAEMEQMTEAVLSFAREDAAREDTRPVDLAALLRSLCDDLADSGLDVTFAGPERSAYACRPVALKRAVDNLIRNAVAYGKHARVSFEAGPDGPRILVDDDGPGIPEADLERVFDPFLRLEASRSRETGGVGLGLAIARSILRNHGGDIVLENRPKGGLRAVARLPAGAGQP